MGSLTVTSLNDSGSTSLQHHALKGMLSEELIALVDSRDEQPLSCLTAPDHARKWTADSLVNRHDNFSHVPRISASVPLVDLLAKVCEHENSGIPLIIEGWHERPDWDRELFSVEGFIGGEEQLVDVRDVCTSMDVKMPVKELVQRYQRTNMGDDPHENTLYYGKDITCPGKWEKWLKSSLPDHFHPFGCSDLFSCLPPNHRPLSLMCYLGIEGTFTSAHKDLCGSFGHNLMCHTTDGGSAFWFMSATGELQKDEPAVYFHEKLKVELDLESHQATVEEFSAAPFRVYVAEQLLGDLVLVPPRSCHQVLNRGGITIKMSWSRMGLKSLEYSLHAELALYHRVCRPETYRVKLVVFAAVKEYRRRLLAMNLPVSSPSPDAADLNPGQSTDIAPPQSDTFVEVSTNLTKLLKFLDEILVEEWSPKHQSFKHISASASEDTWDLHSCDFCGADIFQSFFTCPKCVHESPTSEFVCCPSCYVEGRSCVCGASGMVPCQTWSFDDLIHERNMAAEALNKYLPTCEPIPECSNSTLESSQHLHTFFAACEMWERMQRVARKDVYRCTTRSEIFPGHDAEPSHVVQCRTCHSGMCFFHILNIYGVHTTEVLCVNALEDNQMAWHTMHSKAGKHKMLDLDKQWSSESGDPQSPAQRMTWAAATFGTCRPIDGKRAKEGFYDTSMLLETMDSREIKLTGTNTDLTSHSNFMNTSSNVINPSTWDQTEWSDSTDDDHGLVEDTSDDDYLPTRRAPAKKRASDSVSKLSIKPRLQNTPYVMVPSVGKKRKLFSAVPIQPSKKAKHDSCQTSLPNTLLAGITTHASSRQLKAEPLDSPYFPNSNTNRVAKRRSVPVEAALTPDLPRIGPPPRSAKREFPSDNASPFPRSTRPKLKKPVPCVPETQDKGVSASLLDSDPPMEVAKLTDLTEQQQQRIAGLEKQVNELEKALETLRLTDTTQRIRVRKLEEDRAKKMGELVENNKLKGKIVEMQHELEAMKRREANFQQVVTQQHANWAESIRDRDLQIANLKEQLQQRQIPVLASERGSLIDPSTMEQSTQNPMWPSSSMTLPQSGLVEHHDEQGWPMGTPAQDGLISEQSWQHAVTSNGSHPERVRVQGQRGVSFDPRGRQRQPSSHHASELGEPEEASSSQARYPYVNTRRVEQEAYPPQTYPEQSAWWTHDAGGTPPTHNTIPGYPAGDRRFNIDFAYQQYSSTKDQLAAESRRGEAPLERNDTVTLREDQCDYGPHLPISNQPWGGNEGMGSGIVRNENTRHYQGDHTMQPSSLFLEPHSRLHYLKAEQESLHVQGPPEEQRGKSADNQPLTNGNKDRSDDIQHAVLQSAQPVTDQP